MTAHAVNSSSGSIVPYFEARPASLLWTKYTRKLSGSFFHSYLFNIFVFIGIFIQFMLDFEAFSAYNSAYPENRAGITRYYHTGVQP